jgi:hypothetical protein
MLFQGKPMLSENQSHKGGRFARIHEPQISFLDLAFGFFPAFRDIMTGRTHLATNADGTIASMHVLDGLPREWADEFDTTGQIISLRDGIMAGFMRGDSFFTLDDLRHSVQDG